MKFLTLFLISSAVMKLEALLNVQSYFTTSFSSESCTDACTRHGFKCDQTVFNLKSFNFSILNCLKRSFIDIHTEAMQSAISEMRLSCRSSTTENDQSNPTVHIGDPPALVGRCTSINVAGNYRSTCDSVSPNLRKRRICHCIVPQMTLPKCTQGWDFFNDSCFRPFHLHYGIMQWTAESICQEHNAHLAALTTDDQLEFLKDNYFYLLLQAAIAAYGWVGAVDDFPQRESGEFFEFMSSQDNLYPGYYRSDHTALVLYRSTDDPTTGTLKLRIANRVPWYHTTWVAGEKARAKFTKDEDGWFTAKEKLFKIIATTDTLTNNKARCSQLKAYLAEPQNQFELDILAELIEKEYAPSTVPLNFRLAFIGGSYHIAPRSIRWFDPDFKSVPVSNLNPKYLAQSEANLEFCFWLYYVGGASDHFRMTDMPCEYQPASFTCKKPAHTEIIGRSKKMHFMYERMRNLRMNNGRANSYRNVSDVICHHLCSNLVNCYGVNYDYTESMCEIVERKPQTDQFSETLGWSFYYRKHTYAGAE